MCENNYSIIELNLHLLFIMCDALITPRRDTIAAANARKVFLNSVGELITKKDMCSLVTLTKCPFNAISIINRLCT